MDGSCDLDDAGCSKLVFSSGGQSDGYALRPRNASRVSLWNAEVDGLELPAYAVLLFFAAHIRQAELAAEHKHNGFSWI